MNEFQNKKEIALNMKNFYFLYPQQAHKLLFRQEQEIFFYTKYLKKNGYFKK